ncbi:MAG: glycosyltransferase [Lachnospiraceae bacterium]|nr:glycosyltransferase [Lachnospiraceae bacterium]
MIPIVLIAYNRPDALKRLLGSVKGAYYGEEKDIVLIISVDGGGSEEVLQAAEGFEWEHGIKKVVRHEKNLGLKRHVLECGDYASEYGSVLMLEDDLTVSEGFYSYALKALQFASEKKGIGGISLYNHLLNVHAREPFYAIDDGYDNYYLQLASSWGQVYSKEMWEGFRKWLADNDGKDLASKDMPANVSSWSESSWLKYNIRYLIEKDLYFIYPRISLSTNFMEEGSHSKARTFDLQVPVLYGHKEDYVFSDIPVSLAVYDAFFENTRLKKAVAELTGSRAEDCIIDLYGYRGGQDAKRYLLSSASLPYETVKSFARCVRPLDANVFMDIPGNELFLYDLQKPGKAPKTDEGLKYLYNNRAIKLKEMAGIVKHRLRKE